VTVHPTAREGFVAGDVYERGRPNHPPAVVEALEIRSDDVVCDLGCGTGKLTRLLHTTGAHVVGVEPLPAMLSVFREHLPGTAVVAGLAESLPVRDATFDLVVCANAFHWFRHDLAIPQIHRVLRSGGRLAIVWNRRDQLTGWAAEFWQITEEHRGDTPGYRTGAWRRALEASPLFGPIDERWFDHVQRADVDGLLARVMSISFIEVLSPQKRADVFDRVRHFLATHPDTRDRSEFELPYKTVLYRSTALSRS
jgi:SAM-dependent methyltransferase